MGTNKKLEIIREILSTSFLTATEKSLDQGLKFKYKSYFCEDIAFGQEVVTIKGWIVDIVVFEAGYGEKIIQQFSYPKPNNIEVKNLEYHALLDVLSNLIQTSIISYYELGKILATDIQLQSTAKNSI